MNAENLSEHVALPCGAVLKNRIAKAAMTEGLASGDSLCNERFIRLYEKWGRGGAGLQVSGNVLVDRWNLERGGNLAIVGQQSNSAHAAAYDRTEGKTAKALVR